MNTFLRNILFGLACMLTALLAVPVAFNTYVPFYIVESDSMLPAYRVGSVVLVHRYLPRDLQALVGKGIVYVDQAGGRIIVHRVAAVDGKRLVTKGDNNPTPDMFKPTADDVLGIVWGNT